MAVMGGTNGIIQLRHQDFKERLLIVAGMSRAGTTFLYHNLQKHPGIFVPRRKEICYFAHHFDKGPDWYLSHYNGLKPHQLALDICGLYFLNSTALERIRDFNPRARIIIGVRDPLDWIFSLYAQYKNNFEVPPFAQFLQGCTIRREGVEIQLSFERGAIKAALQAYRQAFGESLLLYHFPLLGNDALTLLQAIESFAGLPAHFQPGNFTDRKVNARGQKRSTLVYRFLLIPGMANLISRIIPRPLLFAMRRRVETSSGNHGSATPSDPIPEELEMVRQQFAEDQRFVEELFARKPILMDHSQ